MNALLVEAVIWLLKQHCPANNRARPIGATPDCGLFGGDTRCEACTLVARIQLAGMGL